MGTQKTLAGRVAFVSLLSVLALVLTIATGPAPVHAGEVFTPKRGTFVRKAILDAVRKPVERGMKQKVIFIVDHIKVFGTWAFVRARPRTPKGGKLSFKGTRWAKAHREGFVDDGLAALLRQDSRGWLVIQWVMGPTDVAWEPWPKEYGAPKAIFR